MEAAQAKARALQERARALEDVSDRLSRLFSKEMNPWKRGKELEWVLNRLFELHGIGVWQAFTVRGVEHQGIVEQIDGALALDGKLNLIEVKWLADPVDRGDVGYFASKVMVRDGAGGIFIAHPGFTGPAIDCAREFLAHRTMVLVELGEIVMLLAEHQDLAEFLRRKVDAAVLDKDPFFKPRVS